MYQTLTATEAEVIDALRSEDPPAALQECDSDAIDVMRENGPYYALTPVEVEDLNQEAFYRWESRQPDRVGE